MPVDLYDLMTRRGRALTISVGPEPTDTISVRYKPDAYTKEIEAKILAANQSSAPARGIADGLAALLDWWDLTAGGNPFPLTPENIEAIGLPICQLIWNAINADFVEADTKKG